MTEIPLILGLELAGKRIGELQDAVQDLRRENLKLWSLSLRLAELVAKHLGVSQEEISSAYADEIRKRRDHHLD